MTFRALLQAYESARPFTPEEAWRLFRAAAIAEAVGWTLLAAAVGLQAYHLRVASYAIPIAGQIHGIIFISYFLILAATYSSLEWSRSRALMAVLAGIPPYGSLIFETWVARRRRPQAAQDTGLVAAALVRRGRNVFVTQPTEAHEWSLPSTYVGAHKSARAGIGRLSETPA